MAKYDPLMDWLLGQRAKRIEMTFNEIGGLVGGLPASAARYREWWANEHGKTIHVQCLAWMKAGYRVEGVDLEKRRVTFARDR